MMQSHCNVSTSFVANCQPAIAVQPSKRTFHYPSVLAQSVAALHSLTGYATLDASLAQRSPAPLVVVAFVCVQLVRPLTPSASLPLRFVSRLDRIYEFLKHLGVVSVGRGELYSEWYSLSVDHNMALRARFSFIRWIRAGLFAPLLAATDALSRLALDQSNLSASPNLSSNVWCNFSHTPACCQSRSLRQQVTPLPQPISGGSMCQGMPERSTKMMPLRTARSTTLGLPPLSLGASCGSSGSISCHSSSVTNSFAIVHSLPYALGF